MQARVVDVEREGDEKVVEDEMDVDDVTTRSVTTRGVTTSGVTTSDVTLDERKDVEMEECDTAMATVGSERDEEEVEKALLEIAKIDFRRWLRYTMAFGFDGRRLPGALLPHGESLVSLGKLNECAVEVTLDTGAQVTAISEEQYDRIGRPPMVEKVGAVPVGADGREMKLLGVVSPVTFRFGDYDYPFQAWVIRGLRAEVLLGQDFGKQYRIVTDSGGRDGTPTATIEGRPMKLKTEGTRRKRRQLDVKVMEVTRVPAGSMKEILVESSVDGSEDEIFYFQTSSKCPREVNIMVGDAIVCGDQRTFPVRVFNAGSDPVEVPAGLSLGTLEKLEESVKIERISHERCDGGEKPTDEEMCDDGGEKPTDEGEKPIWIESGGEKPATGEKPQEEEDGGEKPTMGEKPRREEDGEKPGCESGGEKPTTGEKPKKEEDGEKPICEGGGEKPTMGEKPREDGEKPRCVECGGEKPTTGEKPEEDGEKPPSDFDIGEKPRVERMEVDEKSTSVEMEEKLRKLAEAVEADLRDTDLSEEQRKQMIGLAVKYHDVLVADARGRVKGFEYDIEVPPWHPPLKQPDRRWSVAELKTMKFEIEEYLKDGYIEPAQGPWASRLVMVKKPDGRMRMCVDYRKVNEITIPDAYPAPRIDHALDALMGKKWFSIIDLQKGYYQIPLSERSKEITAFACPFGFFQWTGMPMGLKNAPASFQRMMDKCLAGLAWQSCMVYLDDIVVFSQDWDTHLRHVAEVLQRLRDVGVTCNLRKCQFARQELKYLGHVISGDTVRPNPEKVEAVKEFPVPTTVAQLRTFLGMTSYFREFIRDYAKMAAPLTGLLKEGTGRRRDVTNLEGRWGPGEQDAFVGLRDALASDGVLAQPDLSKPFVVVCDASAYAVGAMLAQVDEEGKERPVEYASKVMSPAERNYNATEREGLAVVYAVERFRHYLHGTPFVVVTDHAALKHIVHNPNPKGKLARWVVALSEYQYEVVHRPGTQNKVADALSRLVKDMDDSVGVEAVEIGEVTIEKETQAMIPLGQFRAAQHSDPEFGALIRWMTKGELPKTASRVRWVSFCDTDYEMINGLLYRLVSQRRGNARIIKPLLVVPRVFVAKVLIHAHASVLGAAHAGIQKTYAWLTQFFWWPRCFADVRTVVKECTACQAAANRHRPDAWIEGRIPDRGETVRCAWYGPSEASDG